MMVGSLKHRTVLSLALLAGVLPLVGCALSRPGVGGGMRDIQADEIQGATDDNLMDLIERLRPSWLHFHDLRDPSDPEETEGPLVMINDVPPRPLFTLQYVPLENVREVQYLTPRYALTRYRVDSAGGVILVITRAMVGPGEPTKPDTGRVKVREPAP